jgi:FMN reductase
MRLLVASCSLHPASRSRWLAAHAYDYLRATGEEVSWYDLRDADLPPCDGAAAYGDPRVAAAAEVLGPADGILLASPVYNYDVNAAAKNWIELTGAAGWQGKVVGLLLAAGGAGSYLSGLPLANSLMTDFRCVLLPRFVYASGDVPRHPGGGEPEPGLAGRIANLGEDLRLFTRNLAEYRARERQRRSG